MCSRKEIRFSFDFKEKPAAGNMENSTFSSASGGGGRGQCNSSRTLVSANPNVQTCLKAGHSSLAMMACSIGLFFCGKKKVSMSSQRALEVQWLWLRQLFLPCTLSSWTLGLPLALKAGHSSMAMMACSIGLFFCGKKKVSLSYQRALEVQWLWLRQLFLPCTLSSWTLGYDGHGRCRGFNLKF